MNKSDFLSITDLTAKEILDLFVTAKQLKDQLQNGENNKPLLSQKTLVMIFEKPSLRTKLSFEVAMTQLGGHATYLGHADIHMGVRESVSDVARVCAEMGDIIMARTFHHTVIEELAKFAKVPVINGLSDLEHPCQTLADFVTIWELKGNIRKLKISYIGDGENNVPHSLCLGAAVLGATFVCASPKNYWMKKEIVTRAKEIAKQTKAVIHETTYPKEAVEYADVVYTDTWVSMGDEKEKEKRLKIFLPYQVTNKLILLAKKDAIFMHDLPAYRGNEVTPEVIDGQQSVVFQQVGNRLHAQKALILRLLDIKILEN